VSGEMWCTVTADVSCSENDDDDEGFFWCVLANMARK
jgi:hypothetical protein